MGRKQCEEMKVKKVLDYIVHRQNKNAVDFSTYKHAIKSEGQSIAR